MSNEQPSLRRCFEPANINGLRLKNRVIKAATFEGMTPRGVPSQRLHDLHVELATRDVGLTTVAYCAAEADGRLMSDMMYMHEGIRAELEQLTASVHSAGGAISGQLGHCGHFTQNKHFKGRHPLGPSRAFNLSGVPYGLAFVRAMNDEQMNTWVQHFRDAAALMKSAGFDAIELHLGHGYGLSQFISPKTNKRRDRYGGSLVNRMRLPLRVLDAVRDSVGDDFPILGKINLTDGVRGGLALDEAIQAASMLDKAGVDCLIPSGGTSSMNPMLLFRGDNIWRPLMSRETNWLLKLGIFIMKPFMFHDYPYKELYFLDGARRVRDAVECKVCYIGGVSTPESLAIATNEFDFAQVGRALIADPAWVQRVRDARDYKRCTHCNECAALIKDPGGIYCVEGVS